MSTGSLRLWLTTSSDGRLTMPYKPAGSLYSLLLLRVSWQQMDDLPAAHLRSARLQPSATWLGAVPESLHLSAAYLRSLASQVNQRVYLLVLLVWLLFLPLQGGHSGVLLVLVIHLPSATRPGAALQPPKHMVEYLHSAVSQVKPSAYLLITLTCQVFSILPESRLVIPSHMQAWLLQEACVVHQRVRRLTSHLYWALGRLLVNLQGLPSALFQLPTLDRLRADRLASLMLSGMPLALARSRPNHSGALLTLEMEPPLATWPGTALQVLNHMVSCLQMVVWKVNRLAYLSITPVCLQLLRTLYMEDPTANQLPMHCYPRVACSLADQLEFHIASCLAVSGRSVEL